MLLPLTLGLLHACEPDHVAAVTSVSLEDRRAAWRIGLFFGLSHMLAVALLALLSLGLGRALAGDAVFLWLDRLAWALVILLGLWNLAAAFGWRKVASHTHAHRHGALVHDHPHPQGLTHCFHHGVAWMGAFFGLGGVRGFTTLMREHGFQGLGPFAGALLLFGLAIVVAFMALSWAAGWVAGRLPRRLLYAASGLGNLAVGLWLLAK
jgi:ABC-type nickel/cobalt efflux system permease component RcnA